MPPNGRRRYSKIVAPLTQNRETEIVGGLRNALDRGETLAKAKQSFLNAGYKAAEIDAAVQKMPTGSQIATPVAQPTTPAATTPAATPATPTTPAAPATTTATQPLPIASTTTTTKPGEKKKLSKKFIIILVSIGVSILIIAGILGWNWNKWFVS